MLVLFANLCYLPPIVLADRQLFVGGLPAKTNLSTNWPVLQESFVNKRCQTCQNFSSQESPQRASFFQTVENVSAKTRTRRNRKRTFLVSTHLPKCFLEFVKNVHAPKNTCHNNEDSSQGDNPEGQIPFVKTPDFKEGPRTCHAKRHYNHDELSTPGENFLFVAVENCTLVKVAGNSIPTSPA